MVPHNEGLVAYWSTPVDFRALAIHLTQGSAQHLGMRLFPSRTDAPGPLFQGRGCSDPDTLHPTRGRRSGRMAAATVALPAAWAQLRQLERDLWSRDEVSRGLARHPRPALETWRSRAADCAL